MVYPIQFDDYRYYLLGISPESHFHHYMTWSGRIIVDYTSALYPVYTFSTRVFHQRCRFDTGGFVISL